MSSRRSVRQLLVAVLLGVLVGGGLMAVTPAGAEVSSAVATNWKKIWKKNLKPLADRRYYKKSASDAKYSTKAETAAGDAASTPPPTPSSAATTRRPRRTRRPRLEGRGRREVRRRRLATARRSGREVRAVSLDAPRNVRAEGGGCGRWRDHLQPHQLQHQPRGAADRRVQGIRRCGQPELHGHRCCPGSGSGVPLRLRVRGEQRGRTVLLQRRRRFGSVLVRGAHANLISGSRYLLLFDRLLGPDTRGSARGEALVQPRRQERDCRVSMTAPN